MASDREGRNPWQWRGAEIELVTGAALALEALLPPPRTYSLLPSPEMPLLLSCDRVFVLRHCYFVRRLCPASLASLLWALIGGGSRTFTHPKGKTSGPTQGQQAGGLAFWIVGGVGSSGGQGLCSGILWPANQVPRRGLLLTPPFPASSCPQANSTVSRTTVTDCPATRRGRGRQWLLYLER